MITFDDALADWQAKEQAAIEAKWTRRTAEANAMLHAEGKTVAEKEARVVIECADEGREADLAATGDRGGAVRTAIGGGRIVRVAGAGRMAR
jgi:hypothetical protein